MWETGLSFFWGGSILGQSEKCRQPQHWAPACEQGLSFTQCSVSSPMSLLITIFLMIPLQSSTRNFFLVIVQQTFSFFSQTASQKLESTPKVVYPFAYMFFKFHTASLKLLLQVTRLDLSSKTFSPNFPDFWSWLIYFQIFFHAIYFCSMFYHAESELILPSHLVTSRCIWNPTFPGKRKNPKAIFLKNHTLLREENDPK